MEVLVIVLPYEAGPVTKTADDADNRGILIIGEGERVAHSHPRRSVQSAVILMTTRRCQMLRNAQKTGESNFLPENPLVVNLSRDAIKDLAFVRIVFIPRPPEIQLQRFLGQNSP